MTPSIAPMTLGDIFDRWFKLVAKTWLRNLILAAIIMAPAALVLAVSIDMGFGELSALTQQDPEAFDAGSFFSLVGFFAWFFLGIAVFILGTIGATVAITIVGSAEMSEQSPTWEEALKTAFGARFFKVLGQYILEILGLGLIIAIPYGLLIAGIAAESVALGLFGGFLIFVSVIGVVYLAISFAFTVPIISWENEDIIASFRRSWNLVQGHWWRTFGILILMGMVVSFGVSIVMTPLYIIALWDFFQSYFEILSSLGGGEPDPAAFRELISSFGFGFGIVSAISSIVQVIVAPLYTVVIYFDLRARRGEFGTVAPAQGTVPSV